MYRKSPSLSNAWRPDFAEGRPVGCRWFHLGRRARFSAFVAGYISWFDKLIWSLLVQHLFWPLLTMYQDLPQRLFSKLRSSLKHLCIYIKLLFLNSYHKAKFSVFESSDIEIKKNWTLFEWNHSLIVMKELSSFNWALWCLQHSAHDLQAATPNQPPLIRARFSGRKPRSVQSLSNVRRWGEIELKEAKV